MYESPRELAHELGAFVSRRFGARGAQAWTAQAVETLEATKERMEAAPAAAAAAAPSPVEAIKDGVRSWYDDGQRL